MANVVEFFKPGDHVTWQVAAATADVQTVTITGTPTGGTFTLTFNGYSTAPIPYNATAAQVQTALQALPSVGTDNVRVTGGPGPGTPFVVTFANTLGAGPQSVMTSTDAFTGGSSPASAIAHTTTGVARLVFGGQFVEAAGDHICRHPAAGGSVLIVGLAITDGVGSSLNQTQQQVTVVDDGVWPVLAGAAIAAGQRVEVGANGLVVPLASGRSVGWARAAAAAGTYAEIDVNVI